jgi:hypothetical protein
MRIMFKHGQRRYQGHRLRVAAPRDHRLGWAGA